MLVGCGPLGQDRDHAEAFGCHQWREEDLEGKDSLGAFSSVFLRFSSVFLRFSSVFLGFLRFS